ncbi:hypothetical protein KAU33_16025 [Candidatus Dependentiae bacterium]|nr:hypothetical protein [Candidatus Dependentiae bacterium]
MIPDYEYRLDNVFCEAFDTNDEPMKDWVMIKFELRKLRLLLEKVRVEGEDVIDKEE